MSRQPLATALDINTTEASERTPNQVKCTVDVAHSQWAGETIALHCKTVQTKVCCDLLSGGRFCFILEIMQHQGKGLPGRIMTECNITDQEPLAPPS